ncbi:MAG: hypothetical protein RLZZ241_1825 [Bacteroidota bacterium]
MNTSLEPLNWRYAVKKFDSEKCLSDVQIEHLKAAFNLTATSYGLQPIRLLIIHDKGLQEQIAVHAFGQRQVADASHVFVLCIETKIDRDFIENYFNRVTEVRGTAPEILNPFKQSLIRRFGTMPTEEIEAWAKNQAYLALGKLLAVCAYAQIDSCPMEGFDANAVNHLLNLEAKGLKSVLLFPVGYRASDDKFGVFKKVRRDVRDSVLTLTANEHK